MAAARGNPGLVSCHQEAFEAIKTELFEGASFPVDSVEIAGTVNWRGTTINNLFISKDVRIVELEESQILGFAPGYTPGGSLRGLTVYELRKVLLNRNYWCVETLVHETLHSLSITARRLDLGTRYSQLFEGLTEFLTSFVLMKRYPYCYEHCLNDKSRPCYYTYQYETKIWSALCHVIPIRALVPIYFWNDDLDWENLFGRFVDTIRRNGYPRFPNILHDKSRLAAMVRLHQACGSNFGTEYSKAWRSLEAGLDLPGVKVV
ncbi:MAG: hypothetical protein JRN73_09135 [Nitrososphaerota archaeon]|nr:hypothetical protein [Nitrososphaerota archaeon]